MIEVIYNFFLVLNEKDVCVKIGYVVHQAEGSDQQKVDFLRLSTESDAKIMKLKEPSKKFSYGEYVALCRLGRGVEVVDEILGTLNASDSPIVNITIIKDGELKIDYISSNSDGIDIADMHQQLGRSGKMDDWLLKYKKGSAIDLGRLIREDYFDAIFILYKNGLYVSAMKLLLSAIDSIAYIEYGDESNIFVRWLKEYADLSCMKISEEELWELRNGLLHMTNLEARRVTTRKVRRISFYIANEGDFKFDKIEDLHFFNFRSLMICYEKAQENWLRTFNKNREKFPKFVERYDKTISDNRVFYVARDGK